MTDNDPLSDRVTAPMQEFSARQVGVGVLVAAVGLAVAFVVPFVLV